MPALQAAACFACAATCCPRAIEALRRAACPRPFGRTHTLLEMFFQSDSHTLSKQEICQRLWPKKPDASDTLYTLIRRIKPVIEANSNLKIECNRNKSYSLKDKRL